MATGKAVAGINYRATAELVHDGQNGYLFEDDVGSCSAAIFKAINCTQDIRDEARKTGESYSSEKCATMLLNTYEYAIAAKLERHAGRR